MHEILMQSKSHRIPASAEFAGVFHDDPFPGDLKTMYKKLAFLFVVLALSSLTFAQQNLAQSGASAKQAPSTTCAFNLSSGSGHGLTTYCVTQNGNIAEFSAVGNNTLATEFINAAGPAIEGYGICDTTKPPAVNYFDYASSDSGNWNAATATMTGTTVKVTRTTADGIWQLVQTITELNGSKTSYGRAKITTAITNLSKQDRFFDFFRYAHVGGTFTDFDTTSTTVFGMTPDANGPGLSLTASFVTTPFDFSIGYVNTVPDAPVPCDLHSAFTSTFFEGNGGIVQLFNLEIRPGHTKTIAMTYKPI